MQCKPQTFHLYSKELGLHTSVDKTKILKNKNTHNSPINIEGHQIEVDDNFTYMVSIIDREIENE